jgi:membrane-associated phospholipid phosphatase
VSLAGLSRSLRPADWLFSIFFVYLGAVAVWKGAPSWCVVTALCVPLLLLGLARLDLGSRTTTWNMVRDWLPLALVLVAYESTDCIAAATPNRAFETALMQWDHRLLSQWGLRSAIEYGGATVPRLLDAAYLGLYAMPPLAVGYLYAMRQRVRVDRFLLPFLLATLVTYALLPHFPSRGPRQAFPGADAPRVQTAFGRINVAILDRWDIERSVFPSGHVTVAFAVAFGLLLAIPEHRGAGAVLLLFALLVFLDTVYARYHYAADGVAAIAVSLFAAAAARRFATGSATR